MAWQDRYICRVPVPQCLLLFFDCETTGLNPASDEITEFAYIRVRPDRSEESRLAQRVMPTHPELVEQRVRDLNGFDPDLWREAGAVDQAAAAKLIHAASRDAVMVAHNTSFDWQFVDALLKRHGLSWEGRWYRADTMALAWPMLATGTIDNLRLETIAAHFGMEQREAHRALSDVEDCQAVYWRLLAEDAA